MSTLNEIKDIPNKYKLYRDQLIELFRENKITSIKKLVSHYKTIEKFRNDWNEIWLQLAKADGGKISLTTMGIIIGSALGGVGIAAMGSAIGIPLALVLGLGGFIFGSIIDDEYNSSSNMDEKDNRAEWWDNIDIDMTIIEDAIFLDDTDILIEDTGYEGLVEKNEELYEEIGELKSYIEDLESEIAELKETLYYELPISPGEDNSCGQ